MKKLTLIIITLLTITSLHAQTVKDTTAVKDTSKAKLNLEITLATRNVARGVNYANSPSGKFNLYYLTHGLTIGTVGTATLNGVKTGFGNTLEGYVSYSFIKKNKFALTLTADDYFLFNSNDSANNYFDWTTNKTNHYIETNALLEIKKAGSILVAYVPFQNEALKSYDGVYIEGNLNIGDNITLTVGGLTGPSALQLTEKAGICNVGISGLRTVKIGNINIKFKAAIIANPEYKNISNVNNVSHNPIAFVISATL